MTPEAQRIAIAEACGWKNADHPDVMQFKQGWTMPEKWCMDPKGVLQFNHDRPNYLNDLNAMHEAEKVLTDEIENDKFERYCKKLSELCCPIKCGGSGCGFTITATAAQRAEAFLRTIGKWKECK
jgi:hypothetical protein